MTEATRDSCLIPIPHAAKKRASTALSTGTSRKMIMTIVTAEHSRQTYIPLRAADNADTSSVMAGHNSLTRDVVLGVDGEMPRVCTDVDYHAPVVASVHVR